MRADMCSARFFCALFFRVCCRVVERGGEGGGPKKGVSKFLGAQSRNLRTFLARAGRAVSGVAVFLEGLAFFAWVALKGEGESAGKRAKRYAKRCAGKMACRRR